MNFTTLAHDAKRKLALNKIGNVYLFETDITTSNAIVCGSVDKSDVIKPIAELKEVIEHEYNRCKGYYHGN